MTERPSIDNLRRRAQLYKDTGAPHGYDADSLVREVRNFLTTAPLEERSGIDGIARRIQTRRMDGKMKRPSYDAIRWALRFLNAKKRDGVGAYGKQGAWELVE